MSKRIYKLTHSVLIQRDPNFFGIRAVQSSLYLSLLSVTGQDTPQRGKGTGDDQSERDFITESREVEAHEAGKTEQIKRKTEA